MATLQQIADQAGVSAMTVSNALNGRVRGVRGDSAKRVARIRQIADELGYRPHAGARSMASGRHNAVGVLLGFHYKAMITPPLVMGLTQAAAAEALSVNLSHLPQAKLAEDLDAPRILRELCVDGLIVDDVDQTPDAFDRLIEQHQMPVVWLNADRLHDAVRPDDEAVGGEMAQNLLAMGHRRVTMVILERYFQSEHFSVAARRRGYEQAMRRAGLEPRFVYSDRHLHSPAEQLQLARSLVSGPDAATAVVGYDTQSINVIAAAALAEGLSVPRDLSLVATSSDHPAVPGIRLEHYEVPQLELGVQAVRMLVRRIGRPDRQLPTRVIPFVRQPGESIAAPPRH